MNSLKKGFRLTIRNVNQAEMMKWKQCQHSFRLTIRNVNVELIDSFIEDYPGFRLTIRNVNAVGATLRTNLTNYMF